MGIGITQVKVTGQMTIVVLLMTLVALMVYVALLPTINTMISPVADDLEAQGDSMTATMLRLFPFVILVGILIGALWYVFPRQGV